MTTIERFNKKIFYSSDCWLWTGAQYGNGYGVFRMGTKITGAHRASWILFKGEIPENTEVMHKCDVPNCVNPDHLELGTHADNMHDKDRKGRSNYQRGSHMGRAKLTEDDIPKIRADSRPQKEIARDFGVGGSTINYIKTGKTWKHV